MFLVEPEQVANRLGVDPLDIGSVATAVEIVSARVSAYVGGFIGRARDLDGSPMARAVVVQGTSGPVLETGLRPLHALTAVAIDGHVLDPNEYRWTNVSK